MPNIFERNFYLPDFASKKFLDSSKKANFAFLYLGRFLKPFFFISDALFTFVESDLFFEMSTRFRLENDADQINKHRSNRHKQKRTNDSETQLLPEMLRDFFTCPFS